jgi:hypothetical protein
MAFAVPPEIGATAMSRRRQELRGDLNFTPSYDGINTPEHRQNFLTYGCSKLQENAQEEKRK